tara:strand:- start:203 stop:532 length:330 start_codon:yes stop_codon:yes gene_type:complete
MASFEEFSTIKATASNRGKARIWVESHKLVAYGFSRHATISVDHNADGIVVRLDENGNRRVAGRERNGKSISILDLGCSHDYRESIRLGRDKFVVSIAFGIITIQAKGI